MKKSFIVLIGLLMCFSLSYSQSQDIYKEANPQQSFIAENSGFAMLWHQQLEARKSGNVLLYEQLQMQLKQNYPERFTGNSKTLNMPYAVKEQNYQPPFNSDWGAGDYIVVNSPAYLPPANNTQAGLDFEVDSLGNKYVAYISQNRDSLRIMKSTNQGTSWSYILTINPGGSTKWHSFDFFIADSADNFKLGFAASRTSNASLQDGELFWISCDASGGVPAIVQILATPPNFGHVNPSIVADSYYWSYSSTYWYVAFQFVNSGTGVGTGLRAALTTDGGLTWTQDTVRNSFNDFNIDIDYRHGADFYSIYVVFTNDLTVSNQNLRLQRI
ncbi:MAG: hypothetical protein IT281_04490 [Ignavibacteria bacterium]|nr:hypothetical protein [Ignavibacteria bacterium]